MFEEPFYDVLILDHADDFHLSGTFRARGVTFPDHVRDRPQSSKSALQRRVNLGQLFRRVFDDSRIQSIRSKSSRSGQNNLNIIYGRYHGDGDQPQILKMFCEPFQADAQAENKAHKL